MGVAASGGRKVIPQQESFCPSPLTLALLYVVVCHIGGGGTLQMFLVVFPVRSADGAPYPEEGHRNLGDFRESLRGYLPATPKQPSVGVVIPDRDGE